MLNPGRHPPQLLKCIAMHGPRDRQTSAMARSARADEREVTNQPCWAGPVRRRAPGLRRRLGVPIEDHRGGTTGYVLMSVGMSLPSVKFLFLDTVSLYLRSIDLELRCG